MEVAPGKKADLGAQELDPEEVKRERAELSRKLQDIELGLHKVRETLKKWADPGDKEAFDRALQGVVSLMGRVQDTNIERPREWPGREDWKWE